MRDAIDFLVQLILAITGAIGMALVMATLYALAGGCALWGGSWCWRLSRRWWRSRRRN